MALPDLYCLAYAPIQSTCLDSIGDDDCSPEVIVKELRMLQEFTSCGFRAFSKYFESDDAREKTAQASAALYCLTGFCNRIQSLSLAASNLAGGTMQRGYPDSSSVLRELVAAAKDVGLTPTDNEISNLVDCEKDAEWETPTAGRGKVEFRSSVSMIVNEPDRDDTPVVSHQPIKPDFSRKKVRKATGYAKFNFEKEKDDDERNDVSTSASPVPKSNKSTPDNFEKRESQMSEKSSGQQAQGSRMSFLCGLCSNVTDEPEVHVLRRESSVSMGVVQEIDDPEGDSHWHDRDRHSGRFNRIRKRVPTGHASLMKRSSDDLLELLEQDDTEEGKAAREILIRNTALNTFVPPGFAVSDEEDEGMSEASKYNGGVGTGETKCADAEEPRVLVDDF
ncbi:conserved hypothetical protein [Neospora caninum Liverpool]|uniref:Uncharacterized protein n=1 Tax=Neospora caninum (strain Liverpool) TaxID=572307 RepID=F0VN16_NEOCL|nr:conserved hypothetical protein [Neospora caninum Liverpool]CBZ55112.1 conserved hypothetical protein [Neospora caninum Liverpool]CEL69838.1 TPA: hypothetical protein BN1204_055370 [Neospora caninum Liverpool]|eukprot:XP_003885140.1 conserved hypothetical protein [Neospora caninum Liverpool]